MNMLKQGYTDNLVQFDLAENSRTILRDELPLSEYDPLVTGEVVNFRFVSGTVIWLDTISSITSGKAPHLLHHQTFAVATDSQTKLEDIMGCKNSVMLQVGRIAALHERKSQALQQYFDCNEFVQTVTDISREIQCALTQGALEGFGISECDSPAIFKAIPDISTLVTYVFAHMAIIYLHLVINGFKKLEALDASVFEALRMLRTRIPREVASGLVAPLFVIGSVARRTDEQFFREIFSSPPLLDPLLKHRGRILLSLEEIWSTRQIRPDLSWKDSLEFSYDLLLI